MTTTRPHVEVKLPMTKQLPQDETVDVCAIHEIRAGSIGIPEYPTTIFPYSASLSGT